MEKKTGILIIILFVAICIVTIITNVTKKYDRNVAPPESVQSTINESATSKEEKEENEKADSTSEIIKAIDPETASKVFIESYYSIDSTQTGKFNPHAHFEIYKSLLSGAAIENLTPLDNSNTEQSVFMSSTVVNVKTYSAKIVNDSATTLSLAEIHSTLKDVSDNTDLHLINLKFRFDGSQWLVEEVLIDQTVKANGDFGKLFL